MADFFANYETVIRLGLFVGVFALMGALEALFPRKSRTQPRLKRWATNLGIVVTYSVFVRILFPVAAMGTALFAASKGWGLLNVLDLPLWANLVIAIVLLDFAVYWQHVASHKIPLIWVFHKMHHADRDIDVSTGARFHPVEIAASMLYKMLVILLVGPAVVAVFVFELILSASAMFNHANVKLPMAADKWLRFLIVTPDMHRVHHSVIRKETDSNYGFFLSLWDRIFGSYIDQPEGGHKGVTIGLTPHQNNQPSNILWCLWLPFMKKYWR